MNEVIHEVTQKIIKRSEKSRKIYLQRSEAMLLKEVNRSRLGCSNIAHAMAPLAEDDKETLAKMQGVNIGIITAYNDMLSAHEPFKLFPALIKRTLQDLGATAQVAGGVPAMCDGVTQSQPGMELSLFSRDNIAMGTAIGLSHNVYDGAIYLGVCDKIVPGLLIGALSFGHLPAIFMPAGPMKSGISNTNKAALRQEFAQGKIDKDALLRVESASYHSSGTCTFYGTANSNQMLLEMMGLQLPNSSFVNANTPLRELLSVEATHTLFKMCDKKNDFKPLFKILDERSFVNAIVGLMATGGSSNHTIHLIAMAKAAGIILEWEDFDAIAKVTPLMCKLYPNGSADVNHFREAGGMGVVIAQLIECGLVHEDVETVVGKGLSRYVVSPKIENAHLVYTASSIHSKNSEVISNMETPFAKEGGLKLLNGNLGQSIIKTSALKESSEVIEAPARVFNSQEALQEAFKAGHLEEDFIAVVRYQGPKANGMPELHGLMPP
ncbi:MAG TPA: phosphogluconate dehydratase, partial [Helicobacteraceae bacterium]|nr:phosphogluconate dehydratase [Helicobacteraceae bacterium]